VISKRTQETDVFKVMQKIFKWFSKTVYGEAMLLDQSPDDLIMWIEENVPLDYSGYDLLRAYERLSRADVFLGRVRRRQYYRLWKYASYLMTVGVQFSKETQKGGFTKYQRPTLWQMMLKNRERREKLKSVLKKIGKYSHLSTKKALNDMLSYIVVILKRSDISVSAKISAFYDFSEDELSFLIGDEKKAKEITTFIKKHSLHRVEDETVGLLKYSKPKYSKQEPQEKVKEVKETKPEEKEKKPKTKRKKSKKKGVDEKTVTLEKFF